MPMTGGWATTSMMWMRMPGQTWPGAAASFVAMWLAMMVPMMLPTVAPVLWRHREAVSKSGGSHPDALSAIVGLGYFFVWAAVGVATFVAGASVTSSVIAHPAMARALPIACGLTVTLAGAMQLTSWKAHRLACCQWRLWRDGSPDIGAVGAWRRGVRFGVRCAACCGNLMMIPLVAGGMNFSTMAVTAAAIAAERQLPHGERVARITGAALLSAGVLLIARGVGG